MLVSLLGVMALGSVAATMASAQTQGPWWRHREAAGSQKQIKWPMNEEKEVKGINEGVFQLKGRLAGLVSTITCSKVESAGNVWNGLRQGEDENETKFTECAIAEPAACAAATVKVEPVKAFSELMWKYRGESKELEEHGGQQKIYDVFAPTSEPKEGKAIYTNITLGGTLCAGTFAVKAAGTTATFVDQHQVEHNIVWGTAALVTPQNADAASGHLVWADPNLLKLHHQATAIEAKLEFGNQPAELQGIIKVERSVPEEFGAFDE